MGVSREGGKKSLPSSMCLSSPTGQPGSQSQWALELVEAEHQAREGMRWLQTAAASVPDARYQLGLVYQQVHNATNQEILLALLLQSLHFEWILLLFGLPTT